MPDWRMKKEGTMKIVDGVEWFWCPHHHLEGVFDGLYMPHKPEDHDKWKAEKERKRVEWKKQKENASTGSTNGEKTTTNSASTQQKMKLSDKMKAVLMTKFNCSDEDAKNLVGDICQSALKD